MLVEASRVEVAENRQRKEITQEHLNDLVESIARRGLMHPIVVREAAEGRFLLVAGERRLTAIRDMHEFGLPFDFNGERVAPGLVPITRLGDLPPLALREAELEENIRRVDLTWQERVAAIAEIESIKREAALARGDTPRLGEAAEAVFGRSDGSYTTRVREATIIARNLEDPDVASAGSPSAAMRVIERKAIHQAYKDRPAAQTPHAALCGDSLDMLARMPHKFDCIMTDPPYGMNMQSKATFDKNRHRYNDSLDHWRELMKDFMHLAHTACLDEAHLYAFCSIVNFFELAQLAKQAGWTVWKYPFIWYRRSGLVPAADYGPMRTYEAVLFASKGQKKVLSCGPDVLDYPYEKQASFSAEKPVDVYIDLLKRSVGPGARVCDPFMGSGTIFPAATKLNLVATGIELDPETYKIALGRLAEAAQNGQHDDE